MARPLMLPDDVRRPLEIYLTAAERQILAQKSHQAGLALSPFVRQAALGQKIATVPQANTEKWQQLARLSANLNQLTKLANQGQTVVVDPALLHEVSEAVRQLRLDLLGVEEGR